MSKERESYSEAVARRRAEHTTSDRVPDWLLLNLATCGGFGRFPVAPGTAGTLFGIAWAGVLWWLATGLGVWGWVLYAVVVGLSIALALAVCGECEHRLGVRDPGYIVLDEVVAVPIVFVGISWPDSIPQLALMLGGGFVLFRLFDIWKPWIIGKSQHLKGGWGVVIDDLLAAVAACAVLHLMRLGWVTVLATQQ